MEQARRDAYKASIEAKKAKRTPVQLPPTLSALMMQEKEIEAAAAEEAKKEAQL